MINTIKENVKVVVKLIKMNVNIIKDAKNIKQSFSIDEVNNEGYIFDYSPATLAGNKICMAGMQLISFGLFNSNLVPRIMYDDLYNELSENAKSFIIKHEMGHFNLHQNILLSGSVMREFQMEIEADRYAAEQIGYDNAVKALTEMHDLLVKMNFGKSTDASVEIQNRIIQL